MNAGIPKPHQNVRNISGKSLISMPLLHWSRHSYIEYEDVKNFVAHGVLLYLINQSLHTGRDFLLAFRDQC
jgi:hypothetical protein